MINIENIQQLIELGDVSKVLPFYTSHKDRIQYHLRKILKQQPPTRYLSFLLDDPLGRQRVWIYIVSVEEALRGKAEVFFKDQEEIGYLRALEGYKVDDVLGFTVAYKTALWSTIQEYNSSGSDILDTHDIRILSQLTDCSYYLLSRSFMATSNKIITNHSKLLQALQQYAADVVSVFEEQKIWAYATQGICEIYGLYGTFLVANEEDYNLASLKGMHMIGLQVSQSLLKKLCEQVALDTDALAVDISDTVVSLNDHTHDDRYRIICKPIKTRHDRFLGLIFIHDHDQLFKFSRFHIDLLQQFSYFTGAVLSNCRMTMESAYNQKELRDLAGRLISIQEQERKEIAAEVHDTITQALTGIGYNAVLCQEIANKDKNRLDSELNRLVDKVNKALRQSRQISHNLRPPLLDDMGTLPALKSLINNFNKTVDCEIRYSFPPKLSVNQKIGVSLFRILQEALRNIKKHARATQISVSLKIDDTQTLYLQVDDNGQGFNLSSKKTATKHPELGLRIMRERAEDLGGKLSITSRLGQGCHIILTVPLKVNHNEKMYQNFSR